MALDPSIVLLIGADTAVVDESSYARTLTLVGNAARTTAQAKFGSGSITFDGAGDRIQVADSADFFFGTGDFTAEAFVRLQTKSTNHAIFGQWGLGGGENSWFLNFSGGNLIFSISSGDVLSAAWSPTLGPWYHVAVDRAGLTIRLYINGVEVASNAAFSAALTDSGQALSIGAIGVLDSFPAYDFNGQMDEVRITKGLAQYHGAFSPPTALFPRDTTPPVPPNPDAGAHWKAKMGNKHLRTDENGSVKVTPVTAGSGTGPLTPFAHAQVDTDATGALKMAAITLNPPVSKPTDLSNLRVCTDETGALLVATQTAGATVGPLTNLGNLQARTDARGSLVVASVAAGSLQTPLTPTLNLRGRTDENGALVVTGLP